MAFNNIIAGVVTYPPGATFGPRVLRDFEFVYIHAGDVRWRIDDVDYDCPEGSLVLLKPGASDYITWDQSRSTTHSFFHFSCDECAELCAAPWYISAPESDVISALMMQIAHLHITGQAEDCGVMQSAIAHLVQCFLSGDAAGSARLIGQLPYPVERAFEFMRQYWAGDRLEDPGVARVAEAAGVTQVHLTRLFRKAFGRTPGFILRALRMTHAAELLLRSNYQIQEIADFVGSADPYHFSKQFKSIYGVSPRAYRQGEPAERHLSIAPLYYQLKL